MSGITAKSIRTAARQSSVVNLQETKTVPSAHIVSNHVPAMKKIAIQRNLASFLARRNMTSLMEFRVMYAGLMISEVGLTA